MKSPQQREGMNEEPSTKDQPLRKWLEEFKKNGTQLLKIETFFYTCLKEP